MGYRAIKQFPHDRLGIIAKGAEVPVDEREGERLRRLGIVEIYETKVVRQKPVEPTPTEAAGEKSSASRAAPASPRTTPKRSAAGAKKGKRAAS